MKLSVHYHLLRHLLMLVLPLVLFSCTEDSTSSAVLDLDKAVYNPNAKVTINAPYIKFVPLLQTSEYNLSNRYFDATFNEKSSWSYIYVKQDGKIIDCGKCTATLTADLKKMTHKYNDKQLVNTSKSHDIYMSQVELINQGSNLYYSAQLRRTSGSFQTVSYGPATGLSTTLHGEPLGTCEVLYVVNSTTSAINFKHKGFDANEKWYYEYAEVSLSDKKVINERKVTSEQSSEMISVPIITENKWGVLYSYYAPNGKKINNATLIAEIDGKEVRSSNTMSSDLTLVPGKAYCYVVEWDGKELRFVGGLSVIDMSNPQESGVDVLGYSPEDNALVIKTDKDKVPEVGAYIVSDITDEAPCGLLLKANMVKDCGDGVYVVYTQPATLHEVLKAKGVEYKGWMKLQPKKESTRAIDILDESITKTPMLKFPIEFTLREKDSVDGKDMETAAGKFTITEELYFVEDDCGFYLDAENESDQGFNWTFLQTETWNISGKLNFVNIDEPNILAFNHPDAKWFNAYTIGAIAGVPVIITPKFDFTMPVKGNISVNANMDLYKSSTLYHVGAKWDGLGPSPIFDNNLYMYSEDVKIPDDKLPQSQQSHLQATLNGSFSVKVQLSASVGLYGGNLSNEERASLFTQDPKIKQYIKEQIDSEFKSSYLTIGADLSFGIETNVKLGFEGGGYDAPDRYHNDVRWIDSFEIGPKLDLTLKMILWDVKSEFINFNLDKKIEIEIATFPRFYRPILFKDFKKLKLTAIADGRLRVTGTVYHPLNPFNWVKNYGLCIEKYGKTDFQMFPIEEKDITSGLYSSTFDCILPINYQELEEGATYALYPYVETLIDGPIYRKGITFIPGADNGIEDLPGEDL